MKLQLSTIAQVLDTNLQGENCWIESVSTDSRSCGHGDLFVALKGEDFDGHDFIRQAQDKGVAGIVLSQDEGLNSTSDENLNNSSGEDLTHSSGEASVSILKVNDTLQALGKIAAYWHEQCESKTIAITGSVGKTTVKEMLAEMLSAKVKTCVTQGNFNNAIGLPLTLFKENIDDEVAVLELGANAPGEISQLCQISKPQVGIITQIASAHLSGFGTIKGVSKAKCELFEALDKDGIAIINIDSDCVSDMEQSASHCRKLTVSETNSKADIWAEDINLNDAGTRFTCCGLSGRFVVNLALAGRHNVMNALLALAGVNALGFDVKALSKNLEQMKDINGRMVRHRLATGTVIIDDSYNANPASVNAAIDYLSSKNERTILVLGDMAELGENTQQLHRQCGLYAKGNNINQLYTLGVLSEQASLVFGENSRHYREKSDLVKTLQSELKAETIILIKGSRSAKMEEVITELLRNNEKNTNEKNNEFSDSKEYH